MIKTILALLSFIWLSACVSHYQYYTPRPNDSKACGFLSDRSSVYIGTAFDLQDGDRYYKGTGDKISQLLLEAINPYVIKAGRSPYSIPLQQGLKQAKAQGYAIYIEPQIIGWQRPQGSLSWLVDHSTIRLNLYNVAHGKLIYDVVIRAGQPVASQWFESGSERLQLALKLTVARWYSCQKGPIGKPKVQYDKNSIF